MAVQNVRTSAGSKLLICAARPAAYDAAGFQALAFKEIAEITDLAELGREYNQATHSPLATRRIVKRKGSFNDGSLSVPMARDMNDEGQVLLKAASMSDDSYSYCIRLQDGSSHYFTAQCMSFKLNVGGVDSITAHTAQLEIDNDIIEVPAISFTLAYTAGANGSIVGVASQTVLQGATGKPVFAQAAAGFDFEKWSDDSTENPRSDANVLANVAVQASFIPE